MADKQPKTKALTLTIVIPVFNEQNHLKNCLDAIATQTVMPDEVIVVDNNSTDDSARIARKYPFVRVVTESAQGIVHARNAGFDAVKSDIIGRIDADTLLPADWVAKVMAFYYEPEHAGHGLTGGCYLYNIRMPKLNGWAQSQLAFRVNRFIMGHYILFGSNMALPRNVWRVVRSQTCDRDDIHEDMDLAIHAHRNGFEISYRDNLRVGIELKRVWSRRWEQRAHMARWPRTLRVHGLKRWWIGSLGNVFLVVIGEPYIFISEYTARFFGKKPL